MCSYSATPAWILWRISALVFKRKSIKYTATKMPGLIYRTLNTLERSKFRSKFKLIQKDRDYISTKGLEIIKDHAFQFINSRVAHDFPKNDGKQTPMKGHPVFIAQHATATCCRGCIQKWHGFEKGRVLNEAEVDFVVALIMGWIGEQLTGRSHITPYSLTLCCP